MGTFRMMVGHIRSYGFIYGLIFVIAVAYFVANQDASALPILTGLKWPMIAIIFFFQGLSLDQKSLKSCLGFSALPFFVLVCNFIIVPLLVLVLIIPFVSESLGMGFFLLSIVPTTIALSVAYTDLSKGRVEVALLATLASNLLGTLLVPLLFFIFMGEGLDWGASLGSLLVKLAWLLVVPLILGYGTRQCFVSLSQTLLRIKKVTVEMLLLGIIYQSFLACFLNEFDSDFMYSDFLLVTLVSLLLFLCVSLLVYWTSGFVCKDQGSRIAVFFGGSQKSVCSGIPLIVLTLELLPSSYNEGILLFPLIVYYFYQTVFGGILIHRFNPSAQIKRA